MRARANTLPAEGRAKQLGIVRIGLLGGFSVSVGDRKVDRSAWRLRKAASLVKLLSLAPGHRMHREQAMDLLWPESGKKAASNNLRQTLLAARRALTSDLAGGSRYLASEDESLMLCPGGELWVDVEGFEEATATARRARDPGAYRTAIDLYSGELLPADRYEEWAEGRRQELRNTWLTLHLELARVYEGSGEYERGIEVLQRALLEEPTNEQMHVGLMRLYAFSELRDEALAQYERLVEALSGQLDAHVSSTTERLREEIAAGTFPPAQPAVVPIEESSDTGKHNLPASRTSFVGREHEMMEIKRHLAMTRLLTLTGAGGSGKTRLALEVARDLIGAYPDGVRLAELASLPDGEFVARALAEAVAVPGQLGRPVTETLVDALRTKKMFLVLDNCEHLVDGVVDIVALLLDSCPHLRILATSRQALGAVGEVTWTVSLLSVPDLRSAPTVADLEGYEAIRLFIDRALQRNPAFEPSPENAQAIAQICVRLEGLPLAIELAAARINILSPKALLERLKDRLKLLTGGPREFSERQRTLRSTIEWSYELLEEGEKALFGRFSVFSGGATLVATEAVCDALGDLSLDTLESASSLLEKSLLGQEEGAGREPRLVMLETIREYARERLEESGEVEEIKRVHAQYFLTLAEEAYPELNGPDQIEWLARLEAEHDNMRAALSWALERNEAEVALRLGGALWLFWSVRDYYGEGRRWLEEALAMDGRGSPEVRAMALAGIGPLAVAQGDLDRAQEACKEGLELLSHEASEAKLGLLSFLGWVAWEREDYRRATQLFEESLALSRQMRYTSWLASSLSNLALVSHSRGDSGKATELYEESMDLCRAQGDKRGLAECLINLARVVYSQGDLERAAELTEDGVALQRELGSRGEIAVGLCNLGWMALLQEDLGRAADLYRESLSLSWDTGQNLTVQSVLEGFACVAGAKGDAERAAQLWGTAQALHQTKGISRDADFLAEADARISAVRSGMGEGAWEEAYRKGRAMTLHEAVSYAQEETDSLTTFEPEEHSASQAPLALTRREQEVATLVAQGMTNHQMAAKLFLSERTIEHHVSKILRKLDLASRTEIAAWATQKRLLVPNPE